MSVRRQSKTAIINALENALVSLLKEMSFEDFSIRDLCNRAGVGRSSFYRYYSSKEDVVISFLLHIWRVWCDAEGVKIRVIISPDTARAFIRHHYDNKEIFDLIYRNKLDSLFPQIVEKNHGGKEEEYREIFFCYGVFGILHEWWKRGCKDPQEKLIHTLDSLSLLDKRIVSIQNND